MDTFRFEPGFGREDYLRVQIKRSDAKLGYCRVSMVDAIGIVGLIRELPGWTPGPTLCLGTRSGREIDLLRIAQWSSPIHRALVQRLEIRRRGFNSLMPSLEAIGRSQLPDRGDHACIGIELNPSCARQDVWIGSFDDYPDEFAGKFQLVFSNSFDQALEPAPAAKEWSRLLRPGGVMVLQFDSRTPPTFTDPVGNITAEGIIDEFKDLRVAGFLTFRDGFQPEGIVLQAPPSQT